MSYTKKYPDGFTDKWGNYRKVGSGDTSPVIGKSGPRPELRSLCYGVGINDVMIPYFTRTRTWRTWTGIIRRTDNRDPKWINEQNDFAFHLEYIFTYELIAFLYSLVLVYLLYLFYKPITK